jgi:GT2 family glycosyltransferase
LGEDNSPPGVKKPQAKSQPKTRPRPPRRRVAHNPPQQGDASAVTRRPASYHRVPRSIRTPGEPVVGHRARGNPAAFYQQAIGEDEYPISNNIGVGILSYNRLGSLQRLIKSIRRCTDMNRVKIFVSDESSLLQVKQWLREQPDIILVDNKQRLGIAGNTNRLLRCLSRFRYKLLLNDDVEVSKAGWETFYFNVMSKTNFHHFCYRQHGIYGAGHNDGGKRNHNGVLIKTINDRPHGSVMAFDERAFGTVGYFDESFGIYGMEHVDWSRRVSLSGIQPPGFHDVANSEAYFRIWHEESAVENRTQLYAKAKEAYAKAVRNIKRRYISPTSATLVPTISYVIPCRSSANRSPSIESVIGNIRAQRFPNIEIIVVEQDVQIALRDADIGPTKHILVPSSSKGQQFNKSAAFNKGVVSSTSEYIVLHDADILVPMNYTQRVYNTLKVHESCHFGKQVLYLTQPSTSDVNRSHSVTAKKRQCNQAVDYFEGGSLAVRKAIYIRIGGFDERFVGYGVEDCEFYHRLKDQSNLNSERVVKMIHLWHDRTPGWEQCHIANKKYFHDMRARHSIRDIANILSTTLKKKYKL